MDGSEIATVSDFLQATREMEKRMYPPVVTNATIEEPVEEVVAIETTPPVGISIDPQDPSHITGVPRVDPLELEDFQERKYIPRIDATFPGQSLNPDEPNLYVETGPFGKILLGPKKDQDEVDMELACSYT